MRGRALAEINNIFGTGTALELFTRTFFPELGPG